MGGYAGTLNRIQNPVCSVDLTEVSFTSHENELVVKLAVIFQPAFDGEKEIRAWVRNKKGAALMEDRLTGEWMVGPAADLHR